MAAPPPSIDRQTFLTYLRQSGLLSDEKLAEVTRRHGDRKTGRDLALALIDDGTLTRFQTSRLLMGRTAGFLLGPYRLLDQVGRGGMGRVFKAEQVNLRRVVALKVLSPEVLQTERAIELFLHEIQAVGQIVHPNVVTAYNADQLNGRYFIVLEYVDGPNMDQLVKKQGPLSVGLACDYVRQAANGLQSAHQRGMLHRDIKPANLLVQRQGATPGAPGLVKISDFGLARLAVPHDNVPRGTIYTKENTVMGTPDYLSPEQSRSLHKTDVRSDLYSLGCTFYFLLTGCVPFPGGTQLDKLIRHATEKPRPIGSHRMDVPADVRAIVEKLMAKLPEQRYQTPAELAAALQPYAVSGPTPWAPSRAARGLDYPLALPVNPAIDEKAFDAEDASDGELAAMVGPPGSRGTPVVGVRRDRGQLKVSPERLKVAVLVAIGVVVVFGILVLLLSR